MGKEMFLLTTPPFTLFLSFKVWMLTAVPGCHHPPPFPPPTFTVTSPVPLTPPLPPLLVILDLLPHPPLFSISALPLPHSDIRESVQHLSPPSTIQTSTTISPLSEPSRSRTPSKAGGSNQPKSRSSEPVSPVPQLTPVCLWEVLLTPSLPSCLMNWLSWETAFTRVLWMSGPACRSRLV